MNKVTSEEKAHAKFSASGSSRWMNCLGSTALCEKAPPQSESDYAKEGTDAHACLEFILKNRAKKAAATIIAKKKYNDEQVQHALDTVRWIEGKLKQHENALLLCETRVDASPFTCEGQFGTLDVSIIEEFGRLVVIDYKYGAGIPVDPEENSQLIYYALGIAHEYNFNFSEVELVVIQPRAFHESGETTRSWVASMDEIMQWIPKFKGAVEKAQDPFAPLAAGSWCRWCPAATICPEIKENKMKEAQVVFDDEKGIVAKPAPTMISIQNLSTILPALDSLETWIEKVREHALHVLKRGEKIDGFKLVQKRSTRKWTNEEKIIKEAKKKWGEKAFTKPELLSPAQLEKVIKNSDWVNARVTDKSSGVTIARSDDKRLEVNTIEAAFTVVDENGKEQSMAKKKPAKKKKPVKTSA